MFSNPRHEQAAVYAVRVFLLAFASQWLLTPDPWTRKAFVAALAAGLVAILNLTSPHPAQ